MTHRNNVFSNSNKQKNLNGKEMHAFVKKKLDSLKKRGSIVDYEENVNFKHHKFDYEDQFLANFVIKTFDQKRIIVRSSKSFRGDRVKIGFYDIDGILRLSNLADDIVASIYLVSDEELENKNFISLRKKIKNEVYYCPASHLLALNEFIEFLDNYENDTTNLFTELEEGNKVPKVKNALGQTSKSGSYYGVKGNSLEREISAELNSKEFLKTYKEGAKGKFSFIIDYLLKKHDINLNDLIRIDSSNTIPLLNSGGNPKSDIYIKLYLKTEEFFLETISIKSTTQNSVSCHDYKASDFIRVLTAGEKLAFYIKHFQKTHSYKRFIDELPTGLKEEEFIELMKPKALILTEWALRGLHDKKNLNKPELQVSNFLLINKNNKFLFYDYDLYIKELFKVKKLNYSVPFSWTYPSKKAGQRIQLKMPIFEVII